MQLTARVISPITRHTGDLNSFSQHAERYSTSLSLYFCRCLCSPSGTHRFVAHEHRRRERSLAGAAWLTLEILCHVAIARERLRFQLARQGCQKGHDMLAVFWEDAVATAIGRLEGAPLEL